MSKDKQRNNNMWSDAWRKLKKNTPAMIGLGIIIFTAMIALLGANIRQDSSEDCDDQIPPISEIRPGTTVKHILVRRNEDVEEVGFFGKLLAGGERLPHKKFPYLSYKFDGVNIIFEEFMDTTRAIHYEPTYKSKPLPDILYPLDIAKEVKFTEIGDGKYEIYLLDGSTITKSVDEMQKEVKENNLIELTYYLGTDSHGRDLLSRLMAGARISLSVGFISVLISLFIGVVLGAIAGFYRGWVDEAIMFLINVIWSIPALLLIISITMILGKGFTSVFIGVGLVMWVDLARLVRGQVLSIREKEYIEAGKALGFKDSRIIFRHVFPNIIGPVIVQSANNFVAAILIEAGLSWLGIGTQIPTPSWGGILTVHASYIDNLDSSFLAILPGLCIVVLVFAFMLFGNGLRDAFDTKGIDANI